MAPSANAPASSRKPRKLEGLLSKIGGALGSALGPGGSVLGAQAGELLGDLFGWGDYEMSPPVNYPLQNNTTLDLVTPMAAQIPLMHGGEGTCRIAKREYVRDIIMTDGFLNTYFKINPVNVQLFPWLSTIANRFENFKFLGLTFGFRSLTANALGVAGNPSMGSITFATEYDVIAAPYTSKAQAAAALFATTCKPAESMLHPVECDPDLTPAPPLYTDAMPRSGNTEDLRWANLGLFQIITQGAPGFDYKAAGELWVTYDVLLIKPCLPKPPEELALDRVVTEFGGMLRAPEPVPKTPDPGYVHLRRP